MRRRQPGFRELAHLLVWIAVMLWVASRPLSFFFAADAEKPYGIPRSFVQYPYHVSASFVLAVLFRRYFRAVSGPSGSASLLLPLLGVAGISIISEMMQLLVPTRGASLRDFALDLFGAALAMLAARLSVAGGRSAVL